MCVHLPALALSFDFRVRCSLVLLIVFSFSYYEFLSSSPVLFIFLDSNSFDEVLVIVDYCQSVNRCPLGRRSCRTFGKGAVLLPFFSMHCVVTRL